VGGHAPKGGNDAVSVLVGFFMFLEILGSLKALSANLFFPLEIRKKNAKRNK
jgi:hypothetical protein